MAPVLAAVAMWTGVQAATATLPAVPAGATRTAVPGAYATAAAAPSEGATPSARLLPWADATLSAPETTASERLGLASTVGRTELVEHRDRAVIAQLQMTHKYIINHAYNARRLSISNSASPLSYTVPSCDMPLWFSSQWSWSPGHRIRNIVTPPR